MSLDLSTRYLGMTLKNPLVVSANPLCENLDNLRLAEDAGASAVVLQSLFEEQIRQESTALDHLLTTNAESYPESLSYFPEMAAYNTGPEKYLEHVRRAREALGIPVIASLNGISPGGWIAYAKGIEQAGAEALELNIYYIATNPSLCGADVERGYCDLVREVRAAIHIPLAVKIGPFFSAPVNMAHRLEACGANALVLFNRFYQPDLDIEALEIVPRVTLSDSHELLLRLHWVGVLFGKLKADLAITGGVHTVSDILKSMMAGARVTMLASVLLRHGISHLTLLAGGLRDWMEEHEYQSLRMMQGSLSQQSVPHPAAFERANYMKVLGSYAA
jgi:dihydroorotate dehydrogenase (fumarate)